MNNNQKDQGADREYAEGVNRENDVLRIPTTCPECGYSFTINILRRNNTTYSYICPHCGKRISTYAGRPMDRTEKAIGRFVYIIGLPYVLIAAVIWLVNLLGGLG